MATQKKVDGRTKEGRGLAARRKASLRDDLKPRRRPSAAKGGRPVGGRLPKLGDVVRIVKGSERHALGVIGNEDGKHWIVYEDRSDLGLRVRKNSVRLATLDERHLHLRKLVSIDVAIAAFEQGAYDKEAPEEVDDAVEEEWEEGAFPPSVCASWGLTPEENRELADVLVRTHVAHGGKAYEGEETVRLSTGKQVSYEQSAEETDPGAETGFAYKPLVVVDVGAQKAEETDDVEAEESEEEKSAEQPETVDEALTKYGVLDGRETATVQSALGE